MGMRTWAALRTPVGTKDEFEFRPQDLKGQVSDLLSCLYNPANWRAAVIRLSATAIFSSVPQLETFSFPRHLSRLDAVYEITGMERTCFSPQEQTQPEIFILLADCTEWMGSSSPNNHKWAGTEWGCDCCSLRAVSAPGSCCKLPRLPKALKRAGCHPQLSTLLSGCQFGYMCTSSAVWCHQDSLSLGCASGTSRCRPSPVSHSPLHSSTALPAQQRVSILTPPVLKTEYFCLCLLVCLLVT